MIKGRVLLSIVALSVGIFAETVVKNSPAFQFPASVGVNSGYSIQDNGVLFTSRTGLANRDAVEIAWSLPGTIDKGHISIFTIAGCKIKDFSITRNQGSLEWNFSGSAHLASGVYLATLSFGLCKKNMQILISR